MVAYNIYNAPDSSNTNQIEKIRTILTEAVDTLLTEKQKRCIKMHFFQEMPMNKIAAELGVNPSTVTRNIQAAKKRLSVLSLFL